MANLNREYGQIGTDILQSGRVILNGFHERDEYTLRENEINKGKTPFYPGTLDDSHKRVIDGEICLTRKISLTHIGESTLGTMQPDGYVGSEYTYGWSIINGFGTGPSVVHGKTYHGDEWYWLVTSLRMVGVADQGAIFDKTGAHDDVELTFQRKGLKTMKNMGPETLKKGHKWVWDLPRNATHAKHIEEACGRMEDRPLGRYTAYPRMFNHLTDTVNVYLLAKILVDENYPDELSSHYDTTSPVINACVRMEKLLRKMFALWELVKTGEESNTENQYISLVKFGLMDSDKGNVNDEIKDKAKKERNTVSNNWKKFLKYLLASELDERHMIVKRSKLRSTSGHTKTETKIRYIQENALKHFLGAIEDGNSFVTDRIGGTIENDADPGDNFDSILNH